MATKSWEVSDSFWSKVEPLIPKVKRDKTKEYQRRKGGGRKPMESRQIFEAIVYVLRTGIQWKALPKEYGSSSSIHRYFQRWEKEGFFLKLWKKGLAEYDDMEGIAWKWQSITDREKKWNQASYSRRRTWSPVVDRRNRSEST